MLLSQIAKTVILTCFACGTHFAQDVHKMSLCTLQDQVAPGAHIHVRIAGVYSAGPENSTLRDPTCPFTPYKSTWVEFDLKAKKNDKKMRKLLNHSKQVYLDTEGEFYGPPLPDPKLPESAQKAFPQKWGHLGCCRTKLIVHLIRNVKAAEP